MKTNDPSSRFQSTPDPLNTALAPELHFLHFFNVPVGYGKVLSGQYCTVGALSSRSIPEPTRKTTGTSQRREEQFGRCFRTASIAASVRFSQPAKLACVIPGHLSANASTAASVRFLHSSKSACVMPGHLAANATTAASVRFL